MQRRRRGQATAQNSQSFVSSSQPLQVPFAHPPVEGGVLRERLFEPPVYAPVPPGQDAINGNLPLQQTLPTIAFPPRPSVLETKVFPSSAPNPLLMEAPELELQEDLSDFIYADQSYVPSPYPQADYVPAGYTYDSYEEAYPVPVEEEDIDAQIEQEIRDERAKTIYFFLNLAGSIVGLVLIFLLMAVLINLFNWLRADLQNVLRYLGF